MARWGDLTSFWYMQYAEGQRPDLRGLYPSTEAVVTAWHSKHPDGNLYIAGPLESWSAGIEERFQLLPWGRLVRIAPRQDNPQRLLPDLPHDFDRTFDNRLRLIEAGYASQAVDGTVFPVTLTWQTLAELPPETTLSLRLSQDDLIAAQIDDPLLSAWFPQRTLPIDQYLLTYPLLPIPLGTLPGHYKLQLVAYANYKQPWPTDQGSILLDLGEVEIIRPPADYQPDVEEFRTVAGHDFNGELRLAHYEYSVTRVGQGKGFAVKLLWQTLSPPVDNYTLLVEAVAPTGGVIRAAEHQPTGGQAPPTTWQTGQFVRDQVDLVLPASAPVGADAARVRLSWLRPDGSKLAVRRWRLPRGDALVLDGLEVTEKPDRVFTAPDPQYPIAANLANKARLLGYKADRLQFSRSTCAAAPDQCQLSFDFYWQGLSEMDQLYFVFLHLVDEQGHIVAQHDRSPGIRGKQPTTSWLPTEIIADPVELPLPPDLTPGRYTLRLGLYLPPIGPRLQVLDEAEQPTAEFVEVGTVEITP